MEPTAPPEPTGRDVGPFHGVTTVRVHGGYEICRGKDGEGRRVTILTMGPSAAENQSLRATLSEAYEWVRTTGTPHRDEFAGADLAAEQPWIASLDGPAGVGVRRLFDRLVGAVRPPAPGRNTGTLPHASQPARTSDTGQIPRIPAGGQPPRTSGTGLLPPNMSRAPRTSDTGQLPANVNHAPRTSDTGQLPPNVRQPPRTSDTGQLPPNAGRPPLAADTDRTPRLGTGQVAQATNTGQIPRVTDTGQIPRITDTGQIPRVTDAGAGTMPPRRPGQGRGMPAGGPPQVIPRRPGDQGPATGQIPRVADPPTGALRAPTRPHHPPQGAYAPPGARELAVPPHPMPAYQGRAYTAAPRPIAPPPGSGIPVRPGAGRWGPVPVVLVLVGLVALGVLAMLIALFIGLIID